MHPQELSDKLFKYSVERYGNLPGREGIITNATELHYGNCIVPVLLELDLLGTESQDISASSASILTI